MGKYVAVAMMIAVASGPAAALDVGGAGKVGDVGAGVSAGSQGVSAGVGANVGGSGGTSVGASAGTGGVGAGASVSAGGTSVGASANADTGSVGAGVSVGSAPGSASAGVSTGTGTSGTTDAAPPDDPTVFSATSAKPAISLPSILKPSSTGGGELGRSTAGYPFAPLLSLKAKPGTPIRVVSACRAAIMLAATPLGAVGVYAVSAGPTRQRKAGLAAPIEVRIDYALRGGIQVRQAKVLCRLGATGKVIAVT